MQTFLGRSMFLKISQLYYLRHAINVTIYELDELVV